MNVFTIAAEKILKTRTKGQLLGQNRAEVLFIGRGSGGQISQHKNCVRSLSNPKPMLSTVLELTTTRFMTKRRSKFACGKISALPRSRCCLLFSLHARVYLTFPLTKTYGYGRLCDRCNYMETAFFAIVCDCLRSAIVCDRLRLYGNQPLDRTWFYLLRSSAITIAGSQKCFHMIADDRRPYCDLRSAIIWKPAFRDAQDPCSHYGCIYLCLRARCFKTSIFDKQFKIKSLFPGLQLQDVYAHQNI